MQQTVKHINQWRRRLLRAPAPSRRRRGRRCRAGSAAACLIAATVLVAGCGGGSNGPGVASAGAASTGAAKSSSGGSPQAGALAYSRCMRAHGLKDFPDPKSSGALAVQVHPGSDLDPSNPTYKAAQKACDSLQPKPTAAQQRQASAGALKYAQCMRAHGIKDFPDPDSQGGIKITGGPGSDLNPNNPQFNSADQACQHFRGGPGGSGGQAKSSGGAP